MEVRPWMIDKVWPIPGVKEQPVAVNRALETPENQWNVPLPYTYVHMTSVAS